MEVDMRKILFAAMLLAPIAAHAQSAPQKWDNVQYYNAIEPIMTEAYCGTVTTDEAEAAIAKYYAISNVTDAQSAQDINQMFASDAQDEKTLGNGFVCSKTRTDAMSDLGAVDTNVDLWKSGLNN
jgi:hypothetical protein